MLNVEHLSVNYGYITALTDISFHVEEGEKWGCAMCLREGKYSLP